MRTTITLDDDIVGRAVQLTGIKGLNALVRRALDEMVEREAIRRLALMGGTDPDAWAPNEGDEQGH
jgi:Arc/MetJ family transcription regulator